MLKLSKIMVSKETSNFLKTHAKFYSFNIFHLEEVGENVTINGYHVPNLDLGTAVNEIVCTPKHLTDLNEI